MLRKRRGSSADPQMPNAALTDICNFASDALERKPKLLNAHQKCGAFCSQLNPFRSSPDKLYLQRKLKPS